MDMTSPAPLLAMPKFWECLTQQPFPEEAGQDPPEADLFLPARHLFIYLLLLFIFIIPPCPASSAQAPPIPPLLHTLLATPSAELSQREADDLSRRYSGLARSNASPSCTCLRLSLTRCSRELRPLRSPVTLLRQQGDKDAGWRERG